MLHCLLLHVSVAYLIDIAAHIFSSVVVNVSVAAVQRHSITLAHELCICSVLSELLLFFNRNFELNTCTMLAIEFRFYTRQHICYNAYMLSPVRLSVCPSDGVSYKNG